MEHLTAWASVMPTASSEGGKRTRETTSRMKARFLAAGHCLLWCFALLTSIRTNGFEEQSTWRWTALYMHPIVNLLPLCYMVHRMPAWSAPQRIDRMALLMLTPPLNNWIANHILPNFNITGAQWSMVLIANVLVGVVVADLPPAHSLIHTLFISVGFGVMEFEKACVQLSAGADSSGLTSAATAAGSAMQDAAAAAAVAAEAAAAAAAAAASIAGGALHDAAGSAWTATFETQAGAFEHQPHPTSEGSTLYSASSSGAGCGSPEMVLHFLLRRWLPMLALALCTSALASLSVLSSHVSLHGRAVAAAAAATPDDATGKQPPGNSPKPSPSSPAPIADAAPATTRSANLSRTSSGPPSGDLEACDSVPFETLGTRAFAFLVGYHRALAGLARATRQDTLLSFACVPLLLYNLVWLVLCRANVSSAYSMQSRSAESVMLAMVASFIVGRDSSKLDISGFLKHVSTQLAATQALLTDVLPAHIVSATLRRLMSPAASPGKNKMARAGWCSQGRREGQGQGQEGNIQVDAHGEKHASGQGRGGAEARIRRQRSGGSPGGGGADAAGPVAPAPALTAEQQAALSRRRSVRRSRSVLGPTPHGHAGLGRDLDPQSSLVAGHGDLGWSAWAGRAGAGAAQRRSSMNYAQLGRRVSQMSSNPSNPSKGGLSVRDSYMGHGMFDEALESYLQQVVGQPGPHTSPHPPHRTSTRSSVGSLSGSAIDIASLDHTHAASHDSCTLFFSDIVGFSSWAGKLPPAKVMHTLDALYTRFDDLIINEFPSLYKVETIGDAYVVAANLITPDPDHAATMVHFALRVQEEVAKVQRPDKHDGTPLQMRIGLHSGSLMSGIVGKIRRRWCLFGDCMNMAARTESACPPGCVQLTSATHDLAAPGLKQGVTLRQRGEVQVKGREQPIMMWLAEVQADAPT